MRVTSTSQIPLNQWVHLTLTYDGSSSASGVNMYLNGVPETIIIVNNNLDASTLNTTDFQISGRDGGNGNLIGDVSICKSKCGAMFRVEPLASGTKYSLIDEATTCPCCGKKGSVEDELKGIHVVVDDAGWLLKESRLQLKKIIDEEE